MRRVVEIDKYNLSANQVDKDKIGEDIGECDLNWFLKATELLGAKKSRQL